ncbi:MAG: hypothetical protein AB7K09_00615 [Planctomycetota bacterium]
MHPERLEHAVVGRFGRRTDRTFISTASVPSADTPAVKRALGLFGLESAREAMPPHPSIGEPVSGRFDTDPAGSPGLRLVVQSPAGVPLADWVAGGGAADHRHALAVGVRLADAAALLNLHTLSIGPAIDPHRIFVEATADGPMPVIVDLARVVTSAGRPPSEDVRAVAGLIVWVLTKGAAGDGSDVDAAIAGLPVSTPRVVSEVLADALAPDSGVDTCGALASELRRACPDLPRPWREPGSADESLTGTWPRADGPTQWERLAEWQSLAPGAERDRLAFAILMRAAAGMLSIATAMWRSWPALRQRESDPADLVHDFIATSVERDLLGSARRLPGVSLRRWLATCLRNHIRGSARRRPHDARALSLNDDDVQRAAAISKALATTDLDPGRRLDVAFDLDVLLEAMSGYVLELTDDDWLLFHGVLCLATDYRTLIGTLATPITVTNAQWRVHRMRKMLVARLLPLLRDWEPSPEACIAEADRLVGLLALIGDSLQDLRRA